MIIKDWTTLHHAIGELQGMATVLDMTEEVDLKKLKDGITKVATTLKELADIESTKLEDVQFKKDAKGEKKK